MDSTTYDLMADDASTIYGPRLPLEPWRMEGQDQWMDPWTGWLAVGGKVGDEWWTVGCVGGLIGGRWTVDGGRWTVDGGRWTVDGGRWTVDGGRWTVDGGRWTVDGGRWAMDGGQWLLRTVFVSGTMGGFSHTQSFKGSSFVCFLFFSGYIMNTQISFYRTASTKPPKKNRPKKNHPKTINPPRRAMSPTESYTDTRSNAPSGVAKVRH